MAYIQAFSNEHPKETFDAIQTRMRKTRTLNEEIADYFRERASVEDNYVKSLQKLSKRAFLTDISSLGSFSDVWKPLVHELSELVNTHTIFINEIYEEVEAPLREKETSELKNDETTTAKLVKEYEERLQKVNKHKAKIEKLSGKKLEISETKLGEAQKALDSTHAEWLREAPSILKKYQSLDESRLTNLKESIIRFETIQVKTCQKQVEMAERTLEAACNFDIPSEIESFCLKRMHLPEANEESSSSTSQTGAVGSLKSAFGTVRRKRTISSTESTEASYTKFDNSYSTIESQKSSSFSSNHDVPSTPGDNDLPKVIVDDGGYSIPPADNKHWDAIPSNNFSGDEIDSDNRSDATSSLAQERIRVEIKNETIPEQNEEAASAITRVVTTLQSQKSISSLGRRNPRGRRESQYRNTIINENSIHIDPTPSPPLFDFPEPNHQKSSSTYSNGRPQGLRASISEVVNIAIKAGKITKILVTGEISLLSGYSTTQPVRIKIANFETLKKIAPNTSYLQQCVNGEPGQYDIDMKKLSSLSREPIVIMKYQVNIDSEREKTFMPISVDPQWKTDPNQTSLLVIYHANPECKLSGSLTDLSFLIPVDGDVSAVQSKPTGTWSMEKRVMFWQIGEFDLSSSEKKSLIARFETKQQSHPAPTAIRFVCKGQLLSGISLEVASQPTISSSEVPGVDVPDSFIGFEEVLHQVVSGKYSASP